MRTALLAFLLCVSSASAADKPPVYLWLEPEWFDGVKGSFGYWTGAAKATGSWGVAGPGISPEWTQGGESEWNSMGAPADETKAACGRDLVIPRAGKYRVWVRYADHRRKTEPFAVRVAQGTKTASGELGMKPVVPENDEYQLYWGFSFGWGSFDAELADGRARVEVLIDKAGEAWRQVDALLITDDLAFTPNGREKPPFAYLAAFDLQPKDGASWRGKGLPEPKFSRPQLGGRDLAMWTAVDYDAKKWDGLKVDELTKYDLFFRFSPPSDVREKFQKEFAGKKDVPIISSPHLLPGFYLGNTPDLSPGSSLRAWLEKTKTPFYVMTNYATGAYTDKTGPATFQALTGPLADQFLGYVHGEALGTSGIGLPDKPLEENRREHVDLLGKQLVKRQAEAWSKIYKTPVPESHWAKGVSCLSVDSIALSHMYHHSGAKVVGYEIDATNVHAPMRIAFERGRPGSSAGRGSTTPAATSATRATTSRSNRPCRAARRAGSTASTP